MMQTAGRKTAFLFKHWKKQQGPDSSALSQGSALRAPSALFTLTSTQTPDLKGFQGWALQLSPGMHFTGCGGNFHC